MAYRCDEDGCHDIDEEDMYYCDGDFNCRDFKTKEEAQAFYNEILKEFGKDIYGLDRDNDCKACEHLKSTTNEHTITLKSSTCTSCG